jgi:hypothetical protein
MYLSALLPAGLLAAFVGSSAARQEEVPPPDQVRRNVQAHVIAPVAGQGINFQGPAAAPAIPGVPGIPPSAMTVRSQVPGPDGLFQQHGVIVGHGPGFDKTHKAVAKLRAAKSDDDKAEAREELKAALEEQFDEYLEHQSKELERLEAKLSKLRDQWEKRKDAKDEVVELRLQTLENEANGLGWPSGFPGATGVWSFNVDPSVEFDNEFQFSVTSPAVIATPPSAAVDVVEDEDEEPNEDEKPEPRRRRGTR